MAKEFSKEAFKKLQRRIVTAFFCILIIGIASLVCSFNVGLGFPLFDVNEVEEPQNTQEPQNTEAPQNPETPEEPQRTTAKRSSLSWGNTTQTSSDSWEFYNPYIIDDVLYIECINVVLKADVEWDDANNKGYVECVASVDDMLEEVFVARVEYEKKNVQANESQSVKIAVPLSELDTSTPDEIYFVTPILVNGQETELILYISIEW